MSDIIEVFVTQQIPNVVGGPNGTICVNPAVFRELGSIQDFKMIAVLVAIVFFGLGVLAQYLHQRMRDNDGN